MKHRRICSLLSLLFFILFPAPAASVAGVQISDSLLVAEASAVSVEVSAPARLRPQQFIAPLALIAAGAWLTDEDRWGGVRRKVRESLAHRAGRPAFHGDDALQFLPLAAHVGLGWSGVPARHPGRERMALALTGFTVNELLVRAAKRVWHEARPDGSDRQAFPSGHTARAFLGAELLRRDYGWRVGLPAYVFATGIGVLRLYNDRHWVSDVVAGAGFGLLSAELGHRLLHWERKLLPFLQRSGNTLLLIPAYDPRHAAPMLAIGWVF